MASIWAKLLATGCEALVATHCAAFSNVYINSNGNRFVKTEDLFSELGKFRIGGENDEINGAGPNELPQNNDLIGQDIDQISGSSNEEANDDQVVPSNPAKTKESGAGKHKL